MQILRRCIKAAMVMCLVCMVAEKAHAGSTWVLGGTVYKTVNNYDLHVVIRKPQGWNSAKRYPAYVWVHGGGFDLRPGNVDDQPLITKLVNDGFVAFTVQYRLASPENQIEENSLPDVKSFMRWLRKNADTYAVDTNKIVAGGGSAGGFLIACCTMTPGYNEPGEDSTISEKPTVLILHKPVMDLSASRGGMAYKSYSSTRGKISPRYHLQDGICPIYIIQGEDDYYYPSSRFFTELAADYDFYIESHPIPGLSHHNNVPGYDDSLETTAEAFLKKFGMYPDQVPDLPILINHSPRHRSDIFPAPASRLLVQPGSIAPEQHDLFDIRGKFLTHRSSMSKKMRPTVLLSPAGRR
ncbi:MAG: alpha/beta hydrolase fold domain-containing protein [Chitinivibrionales bacterium]|nr:alpha/beta hydrolase fold domain-containing protein [Chitinivibrionales bacterium]